MSLQMDGSNCVNTSVDNVLLIFVIWVDSALTSQSFFTHLSLSL